MLTNYLTSSMFLNKNLDFWMIYWYYFINIIIKLQLN